VRVSRAPRCVESVGVRLRRGTRVALFVALLGQLGMLAHAALVVHVTCPLDGELVHARLGDAAPPPGREPVARAPVGDPDHQDDRCLLDEDGEAACPSPRVVSAAPLPVAPASYALAAPAPRGARRAPLFRLAPKTSPPA
jgi:hypothetical protein